MDKETYGTVAVEIWAHTHNVNFQILPYKDRTVEFELHDEKTGESFGFSFSADDAFEFACRVLREVSKARKEECAK